MKQFKYEVVIQEGNDEFWEEVNQTNNLNLVADLRKDALPFQDEELVSFKLVEFKDQ